MNQRKRMHMETVILLYLRKYWAVFFGVLVCAGIFSMHSRSQQTPKLVELASTSKNLQEHVVTQAPPNQVLTKQPNPTVNTVTQTAVNMGILSCVARINQVATFLMAGNQSGIFVFTPHNPPSQHLFSVSFELVRPDQSVIYASANFFPNNDAVYDTVEYVNMSCEEVEKTVFKNLRRVGVVKKNIILLEGGAVKVFLMPAGTGCVVIKKEVL